MKTFIVKFIGFSLFAFIFYWTLLTMCHFVFGLKKENIRYLKGVGFLDRKIKEIESIENADVIFLGSSHTYRGFDPRFFEKNDIESYNLGSSSQTHIETKYFLSKNVNKIRPKLVVYEVAPFVFEKERKESSLHILSNSGFSLESLQLFLHPRNRSLVTFNSFLLGIIGGLIDPINESNTFKEDTYEGKGYTRKKLKKNTLGTNHRKFQEKLKEPREWILRPDQVKAFKQNIAFLIKEKLNYVLVQAPVTKPFFEYHENNDSIDTFFNEHGRYYNFNHLIELDDTEDFYDFHHLNQNGVEKFNQNLINLFKKDGVF